MTTPNDSPLDPLSQLEANELLDLAQRIRAWQGTAKISDNELIRRYAGLGSTKTFTKILAGDFAELALERWVASYRSVWAVLESVTGRENEEEDLYEDISTVVHLRRAFVEILAVKHNRRVILMEGESGIGKTGALTLTQRKYGQRILIVEATDVWQDNPNCFLGAILDALAVRSKPAGKDARLSLVVGRLLERRIALAIDEAHHLGPHCLNTCKTLINQTTSMPCEIILLALPTLWKRLEQSGYQEVIQLTGNRLSERIKLGSLRAADVRKILSRRLNVDDETCTARLLAEASARGRGNLSFVAAVCDRVVAQKISGAASQDVVLAAIAAEISRR